MTTGIGSIGVPCELLLILTIKATKILGRAARAVYWPVNQAKIMVSSSPVKFPAPPLGKTKTRQHCFP